MHTFEMIRERRLAAQLTCPLSPFADTGWKGRFAKKFCKQILPSHDDVIIWQVGRRPFLISDERRCRWCGSLIFQFLREKSSCIKIPRILNRVWCAKIRILFLIFQVTLFQLIVGEEQEGAPAKKSENKMSWRGKVLFKVVSGSCHEFINKSLWFWYCSN